MRQILSKSNYLTGLECPKYLWIIFNQPEKRRKKTLVEEYKLKEGQIVGEFAKKLFPDGINIPIEDYSDNLQKTKEVLNKNKTLFEAGFEFRNCFSRADILVPVGDEWDLIEVKSSKRIKDINVHDVAFQKYVIESIGLKIRKCFLMHLSDEYVRKGEIDVEKLFAKEDITTEVENIIEETKNRINNMFKIISSKEVPKAGILLQKVIKKGVHDCRTDGCLDLPKNHVFCLYRGGKLASELFNKGIECIKDIPKDFKLTGKQKIQRDCLVKEKTHINKDKLREFLGTLQFPIYYLDFETFLTAIPMFDGLKTYSQVPFQFSLHIIRKEGEKPEHFEYLYNGNSDPRKEFLLELQKVLGDEGSIVVYNKSFEIGRLKELAEYLPKHKKWVDPVLKRIIDLLIPFKEFSYYNPKQQGSASIKAVFPAVTGKSYEGMEIREGLTASIEFFRTTYEKCEEKEKQKIRDNLLKYCELDTLAQVMIVEKLREMVR
ncbi:MAG: DUF2779 domain-containing protein [Candidatus Heimdallarchaeota archaeon]